MIASRKPTLFEAQINHLILSLETLTPELLDEKLKGYEIHQVRMFFDSLLKNQPVLNRLDFKLIPILLNWYIKTNSKTDLKPLYLNLIDKTFKKPSVNPNDSSNIEWDHYIISTMILFKRCHIDVFAPWSNKINIVTWLLTYSNLDSEDIFYYLSQLLAYHRQNLFDDLIKTALSAFLTRYKGKSPSYFILGIAVLLILMGADVTYRYVTVKTVGNDLLEYALTATPSLARLFVPILYRLSCHTDDMFRSYESLKLLTKYPFRDGRISAEEESERSLTHFYLTLYIMQEQKQVEHRYSSPNFSGVANDMPEHMQSIYLTTGISGTLDYINTMASRKNAVFYLVYLYHLRQMKNPPHLSTLPLELLAHICGFISQLPEESNRLMRFIAANYSATIERAIKEKEKLHFLQNGNNGNTFFKIVKSPIASISHAGIHTISPHKN